MKRTTMWIGLLTLLLVMSGCVAKPKPSEPIEAFLTTIKKNMKSDFADTEYFTSEVTIYDAFKKVESGQTSVNAFSVKMLEMLSSFDYKIISEKVTKDAALVVVEFTTYDLASIFKEWMRQYIAMIPLLIKSVPPKTAAEITTMVNDLFMNTANTAKKDHIVLADIKLTLVDGKWKMDGGDANKTLFKAITGDFMSFYKDLPTSVTTP
jgi:hypothetical protein